jgi:hypothetical protein
MNPLPDIKGEISIRRLEQKIIVDTRTFKPHEIKESEEWSWRKMKNEKWYVQLDCATNKLRKWRLLE